MRSSLNVARYRNRPFCEYFCLVNEHTQKQYDQHVNRIQRIRDQFKQRHSNRIQFATIQVNQFGRLAGTGGEAPNNFN